jgi:hypothetical protein
MPTPSVTITTLHRNDFDEWSRLFRKYIDFYESSLPDEQYRHTFDRILDPKRDLFAFVLRRTDDETRLHGIAHFYPHQTPWSESLIMHLNGELTLPLPFIHPLLVPVHPPATPGARMRERATLTQ